MTVEEFTNATEKELRQKANELFSVLETTGGGDRPTILLQAQFYLVRSNAERMRAPARRDLVLEIIVIVLIAIEIVLSVLMMIITIREGREQAMVLNSLDHSMSATATALKSLVEQQQHSMKTQAETLETTSKMNSAMQNQLNILRKDQQQRLAELAKKPRLQLTMHGAPLDSLVKRPLIPQELTATNATLELILTNVGDATARSFNLTAGTDNKDVDLSSESNYQGLRMPSDFAGKAILIPMDRSLPDQFMVLVIKLGYPAGTKVVKVGFFASGENIGKVSLGGLEVHPPPIKMQ